MKLRIQQLSEGFTIIEVLIVIAIAGALLLSAILLLAGDTTNSSFIVSLNDFKQQLEQTINETSSGYYPYNNTSTQCLGNLAGQPTFGPGSVNQGSNYGCIFLGKVMHFMLGSGQFYVYSVAGDQNITVAGVTESPGSLDAANPVTIPNETIQYLLKSGLTVYSMTVGIGGPSTTSVGFLAGNIASYTSGPSPTLISGAEPLSLYYDTGGGTSLDTDFLNNLFIAAPEVDLCIAGGNNRSGLIVIGGTGAGSMTVSMTIKDDNIC